MNSRVHSLLLRDIFRQVAKRKISENRKSSLISQLWVSGSAKKYCVEKKIHCVESSTKSKRVCNSFVISVLEKRFSIALMMESFGMLKSTLYFLISKPKKVLREVNSPQKQVHLREISFVLLFVVSLEIAT